MAQDIAQNLKKVRGEISIAAAVAERSSAEIKLIAVSKMQPAERIDAALAAGQTVFGENRIQEASARWAERRAVHPNLELHLIGPLQSNKVRDAVALFDVIQTVDRLKIARALSAEFTKQGRSPPCYIEVNTGEEENKSGVYPADADAFIAQCQTEFSLPIVGLMCIPPVGEEPSLHFSLLRKIARSNGLHRLSMGMSSDYQKAIQFGATEVRVGTAIFGLREARSRESK
jgi:pyridoxal phosphate enzyme (YggS family)